NAVTPESIRPRSELMMILRDELNVREVQFSEGLEDIVTFTANPNFKAIGARFGKQTQEVASAVRNMGEPDLILLHRGQVVMVEAKGQRFDITSAEVAVRPKPKQSAFAVESEVGYMVALDGTITPELRAEGLAREVVNRVQKLRKDTGLEVSDRIRLGVFGGAELTDAVERFRALVAGETLAVEIETGPEPRADGYEAVREVDLDGVMATIALVRVAPTHS
ncbi:MAG TPA: DUF5915 domain-containing protein, partial [Longimicrobium sp.]|nr:DUF5915 domain-containing protein [Longimicrobium sp.]